MVFSSLYTGIMMESSISGRKSESRKRRVQVVVESIPDISATQDTFLKCDRHPENLPRCCSALQSKAASEEEADSKLPIQFPDSLNAFSIDRGFPYESQTDDRCDNLPNRLWEDPAVSLSTCGDKIAHFSRV